MKILRTTSENSSRSLSFKICLKEKAGRFHLRIMMLTVVSTAAFAMGMVGIGIRIRRKGERKK